LPFSAVLRVDEESSGLIKMLSMDSPPFNPRGFVPNNGNSSAANSRSASPAPPRSKNASPVNAGGGRVVSSSNYFGTAGFSNAIAKHSFHSPVTGEPLEIRNVWADNVEEEMAVIRELVETHPYVSMDTEFPGVVVRPVSETYTNDYHYKSLKCNVDLLKIIQLGLSFADEEGNLAPGCPCWQFNFQFDLSRDIYAQDSIDLLLHSGIRFEEHAKRGIDPILFGELLMVSGLVLDARVKWVSYHSGYDYAYLLKLLTAKELPPDEKGFFDTLRIYFPTIYDIKYMTSICDGQHLYGGLQKLADDLNCARIGIEHQAGSDSLLTMTTYFALKSKNFPNDDSRYRNELFGYGTNHTVYKGRFAGAMTAATSSVGANSGNEQDNGLDQ